MQRNNKRCPRCNVKMPSFTAVCPGCGLNFNKFDSATNCDAKKMLRAGEKEQVLYRKGCPSDVSKIKLLLLTVFLGFAGAHYYYVGRNKMGAFFSTFFVVGLIYSILTTFLPSVTRLGWFEWFYLLVLVWGAVIVLWLVDIAKVCFNHFKIPVSRIIP